MRTSPYFREYGPQKVAKKKGGGCFLCKKGEDPVKKRGGLGVGWEFFFFFLNVLIAEPI